MANQTTMSEFFLMAFSDVRELQLLHFVVFLFIYIVSLSGNLSIITAITLDCHLHTPMYYFLRNLSFLDICLISVTVPKSFINSLMNSSSISFQGCVAQLFLFMSFLATELFLLTIMAFDRYVAICNPLHYAIIINKRRCVKLACGSWVGGGLYSALHTANTFSFPFCGSIINQFFCDIQPLLRISCSESHTGEIALIVFGVCLASSCFALITLSYVQIFSTVQKIPSMEGRRKTISTCLPHLTVIVLFLTSGMFSYMAPTSDSALEQHLVAAFYSVVPPLINPIIYSLRNQEIKNVLRKVMGRKLFPLICEEFKI
ncbi:olfactory receptor 14A16-like [Mauremys reevesii]|uniref:olfactory receptor 14A16-like n=1 Tax=Mauremys reevesii TaxID=260615 RepID=UPI00193FB04A|nr:olfactory receptor 14A16-like [Mauremys reevesii]